MSEELKPCPFCGGGARLDQRVTQSLWNSSDAVFSHVSCDDCDIQGQDFCDDPDGSEAIEWWNTRATHPAPDAEAVEVVATVEAYGEKWAGIHWGDCIGSTEDPACQLMTVAQHNRILAATVPAGSRMVPVEPTDAMRKAAQDKLAREGLIVTDWLIHTAYLAMLDAALSAKP